MLCCENTHAGVCIWIGVSLIRPRKLLLLALFTRSSIMKVMFGWTIGVDKCVSSARNGKRQLANSWEVIRLFLHAWIRVNMTTVFNMSIVATPQRQGYGKITKKPEPQARTGFPKITRNVFQFVWYLQLLRNSQRLFKSTPAEINGLRFCRETFWLFTWVITAFEM